MDVQTAEGMKLQMRALVGPGEAAVERIEGFPKVLDGRSERVDFRCEAGEQLRWLWLIWPQATRQVAATLADGWFAWPGAQDAGVEQAWASRGEERHAIGPTAAPWMLADVPLVESWWYGREIDVPAEGAWWLRLPRGLPAETRVWIDDTAVDMSDAWPLATLLPVDRQRPDAVAGRDRVRITLHLPFEIGHYPKRRRGKHKREGEANVPDGPVRLVTPIEQPSLIESASYDAGRVTIACSDGSQLKTEHELMTADGGSEDSA